MFIFPAARSAELGLNTEVMKLLSECEQPGLAQSLLLPEDLALRHLPALSATHRRLDFSCRNPSLGPLQEVHSHLHARTHAHTYFGLSRFLIKIELSFEASKEILFFLAAHTDKWCCSSPSVGLKSSVESEGKLSLAEQSFGR